MIIRDEEVNLRANLALWLPTIDYFVFLVDTRTQDKSIYAIETILEQSTAEYEILPNTFDGFGLSRTRSLEAAWKYFPQATHVWISDPDWRPEVSTMKKDLDLDLLHDVFGFISYDRTGLTTRTMHWLLRQRPGLRMRYNIHEVLDIGDYTWKNLNWVIYEIEKPGSWHATVGHGNSLSTKRHLFDIELLKRDLIEYGHDSHTHFYLGVTHEAIASTYYQQFGYTPDMEYHLAEAIKYLKLRTLSEYPREYLEDRVNCMMILGNLHYLIMKDFNSAEYWYGMCVEYDPKVVDCSVSLTRMYLEYGVLDQAIQSINELIRIDKSTRIGVKQYKSWDCSLPILVRDVLEAKCHISCTSTEAKYILLVKTMVEKNRECDNVGRIDYTGVASAWLTILRELNVNTDMSTELLCQDSELLQYLFAGDIKLHPCEDFAAGALIRKNCRDLSVDIPPINEEIHVKNEDTFIGALSLDDMIHYVFNGRQTMAFPASGRPFKFV